MDYSSAIKFIETWRPCKTQPYWQSIREVADAEIRQELDKIYLLEGSLVETRKRNKYRINSPHFQGGSEESYQLALLNYFWRLAPLYAEGHWPIDGIREAENELLLRKKNEGGDNSEKELQEYLYHLQETVDGKELVKIECERIARDANDRDSRQRSARLEELKASRCDPWGELKLIELEMSGTEAPRPLLSRKRTFEIGGVITTRQSQGYDEGFLSACSFLHFSEKIGLPLRLGNMVFSNDVAKACLQPIARHSLFWATAILVKLGDSKSVDTLFNRESVFEISMATADKLIFGYLSALERCNSDLCNSGGLSDKRYCVRLAQVLPEIISRLCCKCSNETKFRIVDFICELYGSPVKAHYGGVRNLKKRLVSSMSDAQRYLLIPRILNIPFPGELHGLIQGDYTNWLSSLELKLVTDPLDLQAEDIDGLLAQASELNINRREWALSSLEKLHELGLLRPNHREAFGQLMWREIDGSGLPAHSGYYKFAYLSLPSPEGVSPAELFKAHTGVQKFPVVGESLNRGLKFLQGDIPLAIEIIGAAKVVDQFWSAQEVSTVLSSLVDWWDSDKHGLASEREVFLFSRREEFESRFKRLIQIVSEVVGPGLAVPCIESQKISLSRMMKEMREHNLPTLQAEAACLSILSDQTAEILARIRSALMKHDLVIQRDALAAIEKLIQHEGFLRQKEMVVLLSQFISWSPIESSGPALRVVVRLLNSGSNCFSGELEKATLTRLECLIVDTDYRVENQDIGFDEKLETRRFATDLAAELWKYYKLAEIGKLPDVIKQWQECCLDNSEFAELKVPWQNVEAKAFS